MRCRKVPGRISGCVTFGAGLPPAIAALRVSKLNAHLGAEFVQSGAYGAGDAVCCLA